MGSTDSGFKVKCAQFEWNSLYLESARSAVECRELIRPVRNDRYTKRFLKPLSAGPTVACHGRRTRYSSVRPMSNMDFTPAETKPTGQRVNSWRSAEMSIASSVGESLQVDSVSFWMLTGLRTAVHPAKTVVYGEMMSRVV